MNIKIENRNTRVLSDEDHTKLVTSLINASTLAKSDDEIKHNITEILEGVGIISLAFDTEGEH